MRMKLARPKDAVIPKRKKSLGKSSLGMIYFNIFFKKLLSHFIVIMRSLGSPRWWQSGDYVRNAHATQLSA